MPTISSPLRSYAVGLADTGESVACEGTAIESRTVTVKGKAFLFLGPKDGRLKLGASAAAAGKVANVQVGANGWTKFPLGDGAPPLATLKAWVKESHALLGAPAAKKR